jgi:hypothetical protein
LRPILSQRLDDTLPHLGRFGIRQGAVGGLVSQAVGHALFAGADLLAAVDIEQAHMAEQLAARLVDHIHHLLSQRVGVHDQLTKCLNKAVAYWNDHGDPYVWKKKTSRTGHLIGGYECCHANVNLRS